MKRKRKCVFTLNNVTINGLFHTWGTEAAELNDGNIYWTVGIIEDLDGVIYMVPPNLVRFIN